MITVLVTLALSFLLVPIVQADPRSESSDKAWSIGRVGALARAVDQTRDGGFIVAGSGLGGWLMRTTSSGEMKWDNYYTFSGYTLIDFSSVHQTNDGGYILAGAAVSLHFITGTDGLLVKLNRQGSVEWSKSYGGLKNDGFLMAEQTLDGGYIAIGNTEMIGPHASNGWIMKLDRLGNRSWEETFAGEDLYSASLTTDGGYLLSGAVAIPDNAGAWLLKLDSNGQILWQFGYDVSGGKYTAAILGSSSLQTRDGGFLFSAEVVKTGLFTWTSRVLILRLDKDRNILWQKLYGNETDNVIDLSSIAETREGGSLISGVSRSSFAGKPDGPFLLRLSTSGDIEWQRIYGRNVDTFYQALTTRDGGIVVAGVLAIEGNEGAWLLKMDDQGQMLGCPPTGVPLNSMITNAQSEVLVTTASSTITHATIFDTVASATAASVPAQLICTMMVRKKDSTERSDSNADRYRQFSDFA